ncbi:MAG: hypothetical protein KDC53_22775, partial [Saprospiraceae bacterium]|nr:hypothetical protein [Saprospiraceae bacterium]
MRVALLFGSLNVGGAEMQLIMLALALKQQRHEVIIYNSVPGQAKEREISDLGFNLRYYGQESGTIKRLLWLKKDLKCQKAEVLISYHGYMSFYTGLLGRWLKVNSYGGVRSDINRFLRL